MQMESVGLVRKRVVATLVAWLGRIERNEALGQIVDYCGRYALFEEKLYLEIWVLS